MREMLEPHQLRDCKAWKDDGLELSTTSNEAAKLLDLGVHQMVGWYEDEKVGGVEGTLKKLFEADPNFVMGKVFTYGVELISTGTSIKNDQKLADNMEQLQRQTETSSDLSERERLHVKALHQWAQGRMFEASLIWEDILLEHPRDIFALKMAHDTYFYLGKSQMIRDSVARVLPAYKPASTYYGYLKGMYAFGLEEMNVYHEAVKNAKEALEINKHDAWASHALTHTYEMRGMNDRGLDFLSTTKDDWLKCGFLAVHMYWHWCLMLIEEGRYDEVLGFYDNLMHQRACASKTMLDLIDMSSLLYRLELEGVNVGDRWQDVIELCRPHLDDHILAFNEIHFLMGICGGKKPELAREHSKSVREYVDASTDDQANVFRKVGLGVYGAIEAYSTGDYETTINTMLPIKSEVFAIGGSHAQRDVFNQVLIHSAMNSKNPHHWKLARTLLYERKAQKPHSPLTDRLLSKLMSRHVLEDDH